MPLIPCPECGHQISNKAPSCPRCGAPVVLTPQQFVGNLGLPQTAPIRWGRVLVMVGCTGGAIAGLLALASIKSPPQQAPTAPAAVTAAPPVQPRPTHYYVAKVGSYFGYRADLSDNDRARGLATKPLTLVSYQGKHNGAYNFAIGDGGPYVDVADCAEPCEFVRMVGMHGQRVIPVERDSILWAVLEDIRHGQLDLPPPEPVNH